MRRCPAAPLTLALILSPAASEGQKVGAREPVPASAVKGRTLIVQDLGFSIESPGSKWGWTKAESPGGTITQFYCAMPDDEQTFAVTTYHPGSPRPFDQNDADLYIAGIAKTRERAGWKTGLKVCTQWAAFQGGWRCSFSAESTEKEQAQYVSYVVATTKRFYAVQYYSLGSEEPPLFKSFAATFKLN